MVALHPVAHQKVFRTQEHQVASLIITPDSNYHTRMEIEMDSPLKFREHATMEPNNITFYTNGAEMLVIGPGEFRVRGQAVEQDSDEAQAVYRAFKEWLAWSNLQRTQ
ncbi:hypothetical protein UFOVP328_365 [uncultured Caudovirales phage]|uniref:Uncharacterized protein n=1 Tax=uncultured Caudovirales phage TaxID=2100421 RepID=A0A6J5LWG5_9CAUD|nr:hypothetical protein UFOVP328_365 [uncultured Caudovirales phage]